MISNIVSSIAAVAILAELGDGVYEQVLWFMNLVKDSPLFPIMQAVVVGIVSIWVGVIMIRGFSNRD